MNTRWLMRASAIYLGLIGAAATFAPHEILKFVGSTPDPLPALAVQLAAAACIGIAITNWMAQGVLIGGIYARPLVIGNFAHFLIAALALIKTSGSVPHALPIVIGAGIHGAFAMLFAWVAFGRSLPRSEG